MRRTHDAHATTIGPADNTIAEGIAPIGGATITQRREHNIDTGIAMVAGIATMVPVAMAALVLRCHD